MNKTFSEGVTLSNEGKGDEAIAKFNEVIAVDPQLPECYANIGTVQAQGEEIRRGRGLLQESDRS